MEKNYEVWKSPELVNKYLSGIRAAFPGAKQQIEIMLKLVKENSNKVHSVLDLGCGDGILGAALLDSFPDSKCVFLDFSEDMLNAAKNKLSEVNGRAEFICFDYSNRNWIEKVGFFSSYDVIVSGFSIHHQPDGRKKEIYEEIYRLLSSGGIFINVEHVLSPTDWLTYMHDEYFIDSLYDYQKSIGTGISRSEISEDYHKRADKHANILASVEEQCNWLKNIGFKDVDCYFKVFELSVFGGRK